MTPLCEACDNEPLTGRRICAACHKAVCIVCRGEPDGSLCAECEDPEEEEDEDADDEDENSPPP